MIVAILVIGYVLVLRYLDRKNRERDHLRAGTVDSGPPDFAALQLTLAHMNQQLTALEVQCHELARRMEVTQ